MEHLQKISIDNDFLRRGKRHEKTHFMATFVIKYVSIAIQSCFVGTILDMMLKADTM